MRRLSATFEDYSGFSSKLSGLMAEGDMVSVRILHRTTVRPHTFRSRAGEVPLARDQELNWTAIVQFRLKEGKIVEEWVMRDELGMLAQLGVELDGRGNVKVDRNRMTNIPGVFAGGDMVRGQSLVVWAIAEGREVARGADRYLVGETSLPPTLE